MPKFAANLTMLFNEVGFLDRFAAARRAGFAGVEYLFPYDHDAAEIRRRLDEHAGILDCFARPRRRSIVGNVCDGASGDADLRGNGGEAAAVRAADLRHAIAHPHAGHADDQQVRLVAPAPQGNHRQR